MIQHKESIKSHRLVAAIAVTLVTVAAFVAPAL